MSDLIDWPKWVRSWPCIDKNCDGKGTVCLGVHQHDSGDLEHDIHQCQFCTEREMLADEIERLQCEAVDDAVENANLKAEIERLRHDLDRQMSIANEMCNENAKLQALISEVDKFLDYFSQYSMDLCWDDRPTKRLREARDALEGCDEHKHVWAKDGRGRYCVKADCPIYGDEQKTEET